MYRDSVGNIYKSLPSRKPTPGAKPSRGGSRKFNRNRKDGNQRARTTANIVRRRARHFALHPNDTTVVA